MNFFEALIDRMVAVFKWAGGIALVAMMGFTCLDVVLRAFGQPITGAVEIEGLLGTLTLACALPMTQRRRGHPGVGVLTRHLSYRGAAFMRLVGYVLALILCGAIAWQMHLYAAELESYGEVSMVLMIPISWMVMAVSLCFYAVCPVLVLQIVKAFRKAVFAWIP